MKTKKEIAADVAFLVALVAVLIVLTMSAKTVEVPQNPLPEVTENIAEVVYEETATESAEEAEPFMEETEPAREETEPSIEETESPAVTEPEVVLFDVPLDASLQEHIIEQAEEHGIDPAIVVAMAYKESTYNHAAVGDGGNSYGLLQVQVKWHYARMQRLHCTDLLDPYQNVTVAVDYLGELLEQYGSIDKALTAYNRGSYNGTVTEYAKTVIAYAEGLVR